MPARSITKASLVFLLLSVGGAYLFGQNAETDRLSWKQVVNSLPASWYGSEEAIRIADNVLLYQRDSGGWPKNIPMHKPLTSAEKTQLLADKQKILESTTDNGATTQEMIFLSKVFSHTRDPKYKEAFENGILYLLKAQYPNGGWPQFYPLRKGYYTHITYNDDSMVHIMELLKDVASKTPRFTIGLGASIAAKAGKAYEKGIDCILKTQYSQNGKLTAWCAQYDETTLLPAKARSYELPSLSGSESAGIVRLLMHVENPSAEVSRAIESAIEWFEKVKLTGIKVESFINEDGQVDKMIVADAGAPPIWARFYQLEDNRPFFCDRDGIAKYSISEIGYERRNGYAWYSYAPQKVISAYRGHHQGEEKPEKHWMGSERK